MAKVGQYPWRGFARSPLSAALTRIESNGANAALAADTLLESGLTSYSMAASASAYVLIGQAAPTQLIRKQVAVGASFVIDGQGATFTHSVVISGNVGEFSLNGQGTALYRNKKVDAQPVAFLITGEDATLTKLTAYRLDAQAGSVLITGAMSNTFWSRDLSAQLGAYVATGAQTQLVYDRVLLGSAGSCTWQITPNQLLLERRLDADIGSYALQGQESTALVAQGFEDANPYNVHISARARYAREVRTFCSHIPSRQRVIHEAVQ